MGLIQFSGFGITDGSGKVAGTVMGKGKGGNCFRNKVKGTNPKSSAQQAQRSSFGQLSSQWKALKPNDRKEWNAAAKSGTWPYTNRMGEVKQPTGFQLFCETNNNVTLAGDFFNTRPKVRVELSNVQIVYFGAGLREDNPGEYNTIFAFDVSEEPGADEVFLVYGTAPVSPGYSSPPPFKLVYVGGISFSQTIDASVGYVNIFGPLKFDAKVFADVYLLNKLTGQRRQIYRDSTICINI